MPGSRARRHGRAARHTAHTIVATAALAATFTACSDDEAAPDGTDEQIAGETTEPVIVEITAPLELSASADPEFLPEILADDVVTADEVTEAYDRYIGCLAEGGAAGIYALDLELRVAFADWSLPDADANDQAELAATCQRDFLGDAILRFEETNPPPADLAERQRASIVACVEEIDPAVAARIPQVVTLDTIEQGVSAVELQLDATALDADPGEVDAVDRCIGARGAAWQPFGG